MASKEPLRIGLFVGREWSWPPAFIEEVNRRNTGVIAEYVKVGGTQMNEPCPYRVIVDRISHEVPYYRSYLKNAALQGVKVINDPFMWTADDKFFGASLAEQLGVKSPKTVVLPNRDYVPGIVKTESLRNLVYPMDWQAIVDYVGMPCVLKDAHGGGWRDVYIVNSMDDLIFRYNGSALLTMIVQEFIEWDNYARLMCLGQNDIYVMKYDPKNRRYHEEHDFSPELYSRMVEDATKLVRAFGYDMNTVEFAIRDGVPYAIDFMNPAPDMDVNSLGRKHFDWMVTHMADMTIRLAKSNEGTADRYEWARVVAETQSPKVGKAVAPKTKAVAPKTKPAGDKKPTKPKSSS
ncbi:MAG: glutathione synthase [Chloroflexota bacterium]|nr:MAG: glutathione synthase [Chloroflexota bacterium]